MSGDTCLSTPCAPAGVKAKTCGFKAGSLGNKYVRLNVGGSLYYTTVQVLTRHDTMLKAMFSGRMEVLSDKEGNGWAGRAFGLPRAEEHLACQESSMFLVGDQRVLRLV